MYRKNRPGLQEVWPSGLVDKGMIYHAMQAMSEELSRLSLSGTAWVTYFREKAKLDMGNLGSWDVIHRYDDSSRATMESLIGPVFPWRGQRIAIKDREEQGEERETVVLK